MTIDELITFCEEEEHGCRVRCKRYDDASGFTRSKDKSVRTADAITEEVYSDFYKEISATMRKYQKQEMALDKIRAEIENHCGLAMENHCKYCSYCNCLMGVREILELIDKYKSESEEE